MAEEGDDLSGIDAWLESNGGSSSAEPAKEAPKEESAPKSDEGKSATSMDIPPSKPSVGGPESAQEAPKKASQTTLDGRIAATPLARKIAQETGVPLAQVKGTGPNGRIVKEDVEKFSAKGASSKAAPAASAASAEVAYEDVPASNMRKTISKRLLESSQSIPNYFVTVEVNMGTFLHPSLLRLFTLFRRAARN